MLMGSSGLPKASHSLPACVCGKSCFGFGFLRRSALEYVVGVSSGGGSVGGSRVSAAIAGRDGSRIYGHDACMRMIEAEANELRLVLKKA